MSDHAPSSDFPCGDRLIDIHKELLARVAAAGLDNLPVLMPLGVFALQLSMTAFVEAEQPDMQRQAQAGQEAFFLASAMAMGCASMLAAVHVIQAHLARMPEPPAHAQRIEDALADVQGAVRTLSGLSQFMRLPEGAPPVRFDA